MRASTSANTASEATLIMRPSTRLPVIVWTTTTNGPTSAAVASAVSRPRVRVTSQGGAGTAIARIEGCSAAAPNSTQDTMKPASTAQPG